PAGESHGLLPGLYTPGALQVRSEPLRELVLVPARQDELPGVEALFTRHFLVVGVEVIGSQSIEEMLVAMAVVPVEDKHDRKQSARPRFPRGDPVQDPPENLVLIVVIAELR